MNLNLGWLLAWRAAIRPRDPALLGSDLAGSDLPGSELPGTEGPGSNATTLDFAELETRSAAAARCLSRAGLGPGASLGIALPNGVAFAVAVHAAARIGARVGLFNTRLTAAELLPQLRQVAPALVLHGPESAQLIAACGTLGLARREVIAGCPVCGKDPRHDGVSFLTAAAASDRDPFAVIFTSGTSGRARAVPLSHANLVWSAHGSAARLGSGPGSRAADRWLAALPFFHVGGLALLVRSLLQGSAVQLAAERFDPERISAQLDRDAVTLLPLVPTMLSRLLDARGGRPAPARLRAVLLGGAAAAPALVERARALGYPLRPTYGLSEAASQVATATSADRGPGVGRPLLCTRVRISDPAGRPLPAGVEGEIELRGPTLMEGYLPEADPSDANPDAFPVLSRNAFRNGWLRSGDLGRLDAEGRLHVHDRRRDRIVTGGENVSPAEVEAALLAHPAVVEVGVAGVPDADLGARVTAWVVLGPGGAPRSADLRRFCRDRLAGYKVPKQVRFVASLPRTASGKLQRGRLPDQPDWSSDSLSRHTARSALASGRVKPSSSAME